MSASTRSTEAELHVVAGVIRNASGQILIARRRLDTHQGGKWEFPGGKVDPGESAFSALVRELWEELGIKVTCARPLIRVRHAYPDCKVFLETFEVTDFQGTPSSRENQPLAWVVPSELKYYELPAADRPIVKALALPAFYPVLEHAGKDRVYRQRFQHLYEEGHRLLYLRGRDLTELRYWRLAEAFSRTLGEAGCLMVRADLDADPPAWKKTASELGLHVTSRQLQTLRARPKGWRWVSAACHSLADLQRAEALELDFAVLSPVLSTPTHPDRPPLGWETASAWIQSVGLPVYLMGGLKRSDLAQAQSLGAQGIAGIRLFFGADSA